MFEAEWTGDDFLQPKLQLLVSKKASRRKLRLFAVACCNRHRHLLTDDTFTTALNMAELCADGKERSQSFPRFKNPAESLGSGCWARQEAQKAKETIRIRIREIIGNPTVVVRNQLRSIVSRMATMPEACHPVA